MPPHLSFFSLGIQRPIALLLVIANLGLMLAYPQQVRAATLTGLSDTLSDNHIGATGVTHTLALTTASTSLIKQIDFTFRTASSGGVRPAGLELRDATKGAVTIGGGADTANWSLSTTNALGGTLSINRTLSSLINASTAITVQLDNITNSNLGDCLANSGGLYDTCHVIVTTYSNDGSSSVDTATTTYTVIEDPSLTFEVFSVAAGQVNNGITTTITSSPTGISFGNLSPNQVQYAAHRLRIATNAPGGYSIYVYLAQDLVGAVSTNNKISPFGATNATWATPQPWENPTGGTPNSNTGWIAGNTSDTRVSGWSSGSGKFGPISASPNPVATSTSAERSGTDIYVSYAFGINSMQPADTYSGKLVYDVKATY